jgi:uncharacterized protein YyaL (SSP411 family)
MAKPMTVLTQNAVIALFFVKLADLTEDIGYRRQAHWALRNFPNLHRSYNAFAAGFGEALSRLLAPSLLLKLTGVAGSKDARALARAGLTNLRHPDLVLLFDSSGGADPARVTARLDGRDVHPIEDPSGLTREALTGG